VRNVGNIKNFELLGLGRSFPGMGDILKQQISSNKTCIINAPADFVNHTINTDICLDMTDTLSASSVSSSDSVTVHYQSSSVSQQVNDCFATDANSIVNIVTQETWVKGATDGFTKIN